MSKKRWVTVEVTDEIIQKAEPADCYSCLVALALVKATGFEWHVVKDSARIETIFQPPNNMRRTWKFPSSVRDLIRRFDNHETIEACSFRLPARFADKKWLQYGTGENWQDNL